MIKRVEVGNLSSAYSKLGVELVSKGDSRLMKALAFIFRLVGVDFINVWTTVGRKVYVPAKFGNKFTLGFFDKHATTLSHELVHVEQMRKYSTTLFALLYLFLPLPIFFSYFRWKFEREAYMVNVRAGVPLTAVLAALHSPLYLWPWPKPLMRRWFRKKLEEEGISLK